MKDLLQEIKQFRRFVNLNENFTKIKTALFGDELVHFLYDNDIEIIKGLTNKFLIMNDLILKLETFPPDNTFDYVFFSIGTDDKFKNQMDIPVLCDSVKRAFPNAKIYVIRAIIDEDYFYSSQEENVIKNLELEIDKFYNSFQKNGIDVIGTYNSVEYGLGITRQKLNTIKNEIAKLILLDVNDFEVDAKTQDEPFIDVENEKIKGNDETDFDSIYEFLDRFEKIHKSKNQYSRRTNSSHKLDIEQIQIALNFLINAGLDINGKYDLDTENAVADYQFNKGIEETGVCDENTIEELFYDLKIKGFDEEDLSSFLQDMGIKLPKQIIQLGTYVDISNAGLSSEQRTNVELLISKMKEMGVTNPYAQVGILSTIGKESQFIPQNEDCYDGTSDHRIKNEVFGHCRTNDAKIKGDWSHKYGDDVTITELKENCEDFFDAMYGKKAEPCLGFRTENDNEGDGYKYRGRGFNGITFKVGYKKWSNITGIDLVSNPDELNDVNVAAEVAILFFTKGRNIPDFTNKKDATDYFVNLNAGGSTSWDESFQKAYAWMEKFQVL